MKIETLIELLKFVHSMGESSKHFVSFDYSTCKNCYTSVVYIHIKNNFGTSSGIESTYHFSLDSDYHMNFKYLENWRKEIQKEREDDEST